MQLCSDIKSRWLSTFGNVNRLLELRMNYVTRVKTAVGVVEKEINSMDGNFLW